VNKIFSHYGIEILSVGSRNGEDDILTELHRFERVLANG
jgi:hypothetical protein